MSRLFLSRNIEDGNARTDNPPPPPPPPLLTAAGARAEDTDRVDVGWVFAPLLSWPSPTRVCAGQVCCTVVVGDAAAAAAAAAAGGESKRLVVESPWSQLTSECQRF
jgi:hypothetical protein